MNVITKLADKIIVSKDESPAQWQQGDYKGFSPSVDWDNVDFSKSPAIQHMPVTSAICNIEDNDKVHIKDGKLKIKGWMNFFKKSLFFVNYTSLKKLFFIFRVRLVRRWSENHSSGCDERRGKNLACC